MKAWRRAERDQLAAAHALKALFRGDDSDEATVGGLLLADGLARLRKG